jgi:hypothetical protein
LIVYLLGCCEYDAKRVMKPKPQLMTTIRRIKSLTHFTLADSYAGRPASSCCKGALHTTIKSLHLILLCTLKPMQSTKFWYIDMNWAIESLPETRQTTHGWEAACLQSCCRGEKLRKSNQQKGADVRRSIYFTYTCSGDAETPCLCLTCRT